MNNQIYFNKVFFEKLKDFGTSEQKKIMRTIDDLSNSLKSNSLQLHSINNSDCDDSFRSIRVNSDIRIILSQTANRFIVLYVDHHDDAYNWARGKRLVTNDYNSTFIYDDSPITSEYKDTNISQQTQPLLVKSGVKRKHLKMLGLSEEHSDLLLDVCDIEILFKIINILPDELQEALVDLALENKTIEEVINNFELQKNLDDMENPNSKRRFVGKDEIDSYNLDELLDNFDSWKLFLHPVQRMYVERSYNGPVLIEGGPGTGKTIVGIHRAIYLSQHLYNDGEKIYFIVFNKRLVEIVKCKIEEIKKLKGLNRNIEVTHVDKLFAELLIRSNVKINNIDDREIISIIKKTYEEINCNLPIDFVISEFFEVIRNKRVKNLEEYFNVVRYNQGNKVNRKTREILWPVYEKALLYMRENNMLDFEMRASVIEQLVDTGEIKPFIDSMIIDEAQDLSSQKLISLTKLIRNKKNNLFMLSDKNQRIYTLYSWKNDTNIKIQGRTFYLTLNYRTTKEIKDFADLQFFENTLKTPYEKEYKSLLTGPSPMKKDFSSRAKSKKYIVDYIKKVNSVIPLEEICIVSDKDQLLELVGVFDYAEIPNVNFSKMNNVGDLKKGINLVDLNLVKGLEYRCVIIYNIPFENPEIDFIQDEDEYLYELLYQKYECKKYVAFTRARDSLLIINVEDK